MSDTKLVMPDYLSDCAPPYGTVDRSMCDGGSNADEVAWLESRLRRRLFSENAMRIKFKTSNAKCQKTPQNDCPHGFHSGIKSKYWTLCLRWLISQIGNYLLSNGPLKRDRRKQPTPYTKNSSSVRVVGKRLCDPDCYLLEKFVKTKSTRPKQFLMRSHMVVVLCFFYLSSPRQYWTVFSSRCLQTTKNILFSSGTSTRFLFPARWIWNLGERSDFVFKLGYHKQQLVDDVASAFSFKPKFGAKKLDVRCILQQARSQRR